MIKFCLKLQNNAVEIFNGETRVHEDQVLSWAHVNERKWWKIDLIQLVIIHIHIYQPLHSGRIWDKVNFQAEFNRFEFRVFLLLD